MSDVASLSHPVGEAGGAASRSIGVEVEKPEVGLLDVGVAGAASSNCVLTPSVASSADDASALEVTSRDPSSLADDVTSLLDVSLSSVDLLSLSVALAVRFVSATDSRTLVVSCVAALSAVSVVVAAVAVLVASLLVESLLLVESPLVDVRVLRVTVDVASPAEPSVREARSLRLLAGALVDAVRVREDVGSSLPDVLFRSPFLLDVSRDLVAD